MTESKIEQPSDPNYKVSDWQYTTASDGITLTDYTGQGTDFYIPNAKSFRDNGKITTGQKVFLTYDLIRKLINDKQATSISIERAADANDRVVAVGQTENGAFNSAFADVGDNNHDHGANGNQTLKSLDLTGLDVSQISDMSGLFANDKALVSVTGLDTWNFSPNMRSIGHLFAYDPKLTTIQGIDKWDTTNFRYIDNLVVNDTSLTSLDLTNWKKTKQINLANDMFNGASSLTTVGDLSGWNLNNATTTENMFKGTSALTSIGAAGGVSDLSGWDMSNNGYMDNMFAGSGIKSLDVSNWNLKNGVQVTDMFANLQNEATITMNGGNWASSGLQASNFIGNKTLIVISNTLSQDLNNQDIGSNQKGHPANTVHFYGQNSSHASEELASQQENFVFSSESDLTNQLASIGGNSNVKKVISSTLSDNTTATPEGNSNFEKIAGNYDVGETIHRTYKVFEKFPNHDGTTTDKTILQFDGNFFRTLIKNVDCTYTYPDFTEPNETNGIKVTGSWTDKDGQNARYSNDLTAGQATYDLAPDGYTIQFPNGADREKINNVTDQQWAEVDKPIWLKNWYLRDNPSAGTNDNHLTIDIFQGTESVANMPESEEFDITYKANDAHQDYQFVDKDGNVIKPDGTTDPDRNAISTTVSGKTDEDITVPNVPKGWVTVDGQAVPGGKFKPNRPLSLT